MLGIAWFKFSGLWILLTALLILLQASSYKQMKLPFSLAFGEDK